MVCNKCDNEVYILYLLHIDGYLERLCSECCKMVEKISKNFKRHEFACKCGCGFDKVNMDHVVRLQWARDVAGVPFNVISGCRCEAHNTDEGGTVMSDHLTGEGTDIETPNSNERFRVLEGLIIAGFRRIGIGRTFIHAGTAMHNPREVAWLY